MHRLFLPFTLLAVVEVAFPGRFPPDQTGQRCFPETNQCISGRFRQYWEQNGGLPVFGFPITGAANEINRDTGQTYLTQWFERNRFELHPENRVPYDVLLGRLGDDRLRQQGRDWQTFPKAAATTAHYFAESRHAIEHVPFRTYWSTHGLEFDGRRGTSATESLALFGLPLSEPAMETNASGDTVLTQWYERARFEYHPNNPEPFKVLLGLLGDELRGGSRAPATQPVEHALVGATLIDGRGGPPLKDAVVIIRGDRIVAVGPAGEVPVPPGTPTRNLRGKTVLPGFINAHVHTDDLPDDALKGWTRAGVTTVRDLAGAPDRLLQRRKALAASQDAAYPRLLVAGPFITVPGGHPIPADGLSDEVLTVQGPDDARAKVTALLDAGVDLIKIVVSGRTDVKWPELSDAEIRAITETAHARGVRVAAHIDRATALRRAVENGIDDAAHMPRDRIPDDVIALMVKQNVLLVPTIDVYEELAEGRGLGDTRRQWTLPAMQDNLRRFVAAGGTLALGDDYGGHTGVALGMPMEEIRHWLRAGLTPMQILVAATQGSAQVSGLAGQAGVVQPGMIADLLVVDGDPLTNMATLMRAALVVHNGTIITP